VKRYEGTKEDVYLADFSPNANFTETLRELGVKADDVLIVVRPPANEALYHRFENELFSDLLDRLCAHSGVKLILLARTDEQRAEYASMSKPNLILPQKALDGANLIAASDLVISAGGTMNREAAALGVPAATIYAGEWAAIDEELLREGRLLRIATREDLELIRIEKKSGASRRRATHVRDKVMELILAA
jgi:uncharacterized protein